MKTAKIYFKGNLVDTIEYERVLISSIYEFFDDKNNIIAFVPLDHMIIVDYSRQTVFVKGSDLINLAVPEFPDDRTENFYK